MSAPLLPLFVESFVTTCANEGLSEEQTAVLLQNASVKLRKEASPAFAAGYDEVMNQTSSGVLPLWFTKEARGWRTLWGGIQNVGRGIRDIGGDVMKPLRAGINKTYNTARPDSFIKSHPLPTALGTGALAAGGALGVNALARRHLEMRDLPPFLPPSSYDRDSYRERYRGELYEGSRGVARNNDEIFGNHARAKELREAIARGEGGREVQAELRDLERRRVVAERQRSRFLDASKRHEEKRRGQLERLDGRIAGKQYRRDSILFAPWRALTGGRESYDQDIEALQGQREAAMREANLTRDRVGLLTSGYNGEPPAPVVTRPKDIQDRFFR
jgi:hypothetical protein